MIRAHERTHKELERKYIDQSGCGDLTFRRDERTGRPRVNDPGSRLDRRQRSSGEYYYVDLVASGSFLRRQNNAVGSMARPVYLKWNNHD